MDSEQMRISQDKSDACHLKDYVDVESSKWLAENVTEMEDTIKRMLKLIEANKEFSTKNDVMRIQDKQELVASIEEFQLIYRSLGDRYDHFSRELHNNLPSEFQLQDSGHYDSGFGDEASLLTPNGKFDQHKSSPISVSFGSGSGNSDISPKARTESLSSSDSDSETFYSSVKNYLDSPADIDSQGLREKAGKERSHEQLVEKIVKYEEELRVTNLKLQASEEEALKLKSELEMSESSILLVENLCSQLETAQSEIKKREMDVETEKRRVLELQQQVLDLEAHLSDSNSESKKLVRELEVSRETVKVSDAEVLNLREELDDCQLNFSAEKVEFEHTIKCLMEKQTFLETRIKELESHDKVLKDRMKQCEAEKIEMKAVYDVKEIQWQGDISKLKAEITARVEHVETLNKGFDELKLKYDMVMAEKDGVTAKVDSLTADMNSQDIQIAQMEERMNQMLSKYNELFSGYENAKKLENELRVKMQELEKEVDRQRIAILEGEEEKREAIRQLCFSLDHYRSGYRQLVRSLSGNKQLVMVS